METGTNNVKRDWALPSPDLSTEAGLRVALTNLQQEIYGKMVADELFDPFFDDDMADKQNSKAREILNSRNVYRNAYFLTVEGLVVLDRFSPEMPENFKQLFIDDIRVKFLKARVVLETTKRGKQN